MKWKWIDADCTSVTTAEGTLTLKGLFIPLFIEQLLMNMTGTVNTLIFVHVLCGIQRRRIGRHQPQTGGGR